MAATIKVATLVTELVADTKNFASGLSGAANQAASWAADVGKTVAKAGLAVIAAGATAAAAAIGGVGIALGKLAIDAAPLEGIGMAFEGMADRFNVSLDEMRRAAAGTVSDFDLMRQANVALTGAGEQFGAEFGKALPSLLEGARAAARATGQDVDFLFESLVTGIKRSSPLLIDNTGLVLSVGDANAALAAQLGKTVNELTDEEKQIALLNATVEAAGNLAEDMGMGQLTAAEQIAQFKTQIQNTKDQIGIALLPVLSKLMETFSGLAERVLPVVTDFIEGTLAPALEKAAEFINSFVSSIIDGEDPITALTNALRDIGLDDFATKVEEIVPIVVEKFNEFSMFLTDTLIPNLQNFWTWLSENIGPAIDELSIFITDTLIPAISELSIWIGENAPIAFAALQTAWEAVLKPALEGLLAFINDNLIPVLIAVGIPIAAVIIPGLLAAAGAFLAVAIPIAGLIAALVALGLIWKEMGEKAKVAWEQLKFIVMYALTNISMALNTFFTNAIAAWSSNFENIRIITETLWQNIKTGAINAWTGIVTTVTEFIQSIVDRIRGFVSSFKQLGEDLMEGLKDGIMRKVNAIIGAIREAMQRVISTAKRALQSESPSMVFADIGRNMMEGMALGIINAAHVPAVATVGAAAGVTHAASQTNNFNLNVSTVAPASTVVQDFQTMRAMVGAVG